MSALVSLSESTEFQQKSNTYKQFLLKDLSEELIKSQKEKGLILILIPYFHV